MAGNPFTAKRPASIPADTNSPEFAIFGVVYAAEALWDLLDELPSKGEAIRAQRRLQETVFWAEQALAGGTS